MEIPLLAVVYSSAKALFARLGTNARTGIMVRAVSVDYIVISAFLGNSHDLYQEKWYISATLLMY